MGKRHHKYCAQKEAEKQVLIQQHQTKDQWLAQKDATINQLVADHRTKDQWIAARDQTIAAKDQTIAARDQTIEQLTQQHQDKDKTLEAKEQKIAQLNAELKKFQAEAAAKELTDKIEKLIIDSQLNSSSANDFLLQASELNAFDAVKLALDNGADNKDTCDRALKLTNSPKIKIMLFAARERGQKDDNTLRKERAPADTDFDVNKKLVSHWPLEGSTIDIKHINTGKQHDIDVVDDRENPIPFLHFDGSAFIKGDAHNLPKGNKAVALWFKADKDTNGKIAGGTLFSYCDEDASLAIVLNHDGEVSAKSGNLYAYVFGKPGKKIEYRANSDDLFDEWNHLVFSTNNNKGTNIYLNGKCVAQNNDISLNLKKYIKTFAIGAFVYNQQPIDNPIDPMFKGSIKDVMIYEEGLSAEEVCALYALSPEPGKEKRAMRVNTDQLMDLLQQTQPDAYNKLLQSLGLFQGGSAHKDRKGGQDNTPTAENDPKSKIRDYAL